MFVGSLPGSVPRPSRNTIAPASVAVLGGDHMHGAHALVLVSCRARTCWAHAGHARPALARPWPGTLKAWASGCARSEWPRHAPALSPHATHARPPASHSPPPVEVTRSGRRRKCMLGACGLVPPVHSTRFAGALPTRDGQARRGLIAAAVAHFAVGSCSPPCSAARVPAFTAFTGIQCAFDYQRHSKRF